MTLPNKKITNRILYKGASDVCSFLSFFTSFMRLFLHGKAVNSNMPTADELQFAMNLYTQGNPRIGLSAEKLTARISKKLQ